MNRISNIQQYVLREAKGKHTSNAQGVTGLWDFVKEKLGYKEPRKLKREGIAPLPVHQNAVPSAEEETPLKEIWKPGYRGRTDNKRF